MVKTKRFHRMRFQPSNKAVEPSQKRRSRLFLIFLQPDVWKGDLCGLTRRMFYRSKSLARCYVLQGFLGWNFVGCQKIPCRGGLPRPRVLAVCDFVRRLRKHWESRICQCGRAQRPSPTQRILIHTLDLHQSHNPKHLEPTNVTARSAVEC